ncbi:cell division protein YceG involved in septum cleavage [Cytobacillus horneckiae]|uniref:Aminodeoxychorismate lyase n=1 Tax=Cytobacillus horneckiae TaxID=549687 RepID=A0A2N0ZGH6_9BACI|nr:hypothetical protein [Cytobacillus horneckiae]MBN6888260.1 hypothetical protein [Cytobacillus horneckiae]MCM3177116.1 endolytic transglycosylase MltG [Cytobacillus horneckiae]MEC1154815.1 hypothetical protein [Cytobacillus horneckiae]MED2940309.1 hypothetical protein [Cytobacillus horneckiae]PKG28609.1 hypothetical protein CWS20_12755 [Cytobacillus horneckiae]
MSEKTMRSFAGGLIVAAVILGITYFLEPNDTKNTEAAEPATAEEPEKQDKDKNVELSADEMQTALKAEGFIIHSEDEWKEINKDLQDSGSLKEENEKLKEEVKKAKENNDKKGDGETVYRTMLTVTSGMTSIDVGKALESAKIINKGMDFFNAVEKKGYENDLRPGTFEVDSDMSMDEILKTVFKK